MTSNDPITHAQHPDDLNEIILETCTQLDSVLNRLMRLPRAQRNTTEHLALIVDRDRLKTRLDELMTAQAALVSALCR